jgi:short-subunit dehydrogenase
MATRPARHLITGAGSGIGAVVAERLIERGDEVWLVARSAARAHDLRTERPGATVLVADLGESAEVEALADSLPELLDSLVNAAGVVDLGPAAELGTAVWQEQLAVNLVGPAVLTRIALPALRAGRGTVVMVNSGAGLFAHPHWSAYAASKHGLRALADSLRAEEQEHGVRVTSVFPGRTATPMQRKVHEQEGKTYDAEKWIDPQTVADAIIGVLDLPGDATVSDLTIRPR